MAPPRGESVADTTISSSPSEAVVIEGPDLNETKPPLDPKVYRQVLLPNGLWCILIQDTIALHQNDGPIMGYADEEEFDSSDDDDEEDDDGKNEPACQHLTAGRAMKKGNDSDLDSDEENGDDDNGSEAEDETSGIRDAAAALLVGTGYAYDPIECQGMAHFLEHLLFMGSEKYPDENEYAAYVSKKGGSDNAWTEMEHTVYHVSIPQDYLWPALDRMAQHFVQPKLAESSVERELNAIESEFQLNKPSDECRREQLLCATADANHVYSKFGWGNRRSLHEIPKIHGVDPLKEMRTFFERYYYAANMRLVVMGACTLDQMESQVLKIFGQIPAWPRQKCPTFALPFSSEQMRPSWEMHQEYRSPIAKQGSPMKQALGKIFRIVPLRDRHKLVMNWPLPCQAQHWKGKPYDFISHLMGHEGEGSLLSYFREQNWATGCSAGVGDDQQASSHWMFTFSVSLSQNGAKEWKRVVDSIYQYLGMLRSYSSGDKDGWPQWIYEELKQIEKVAFLYSNEEAPEDVVCELVESMAPHYTVPPERVLDGFELLFEFDASGIQEILNVYMRPENCRIDLSSSHFGKYADMDSSIDADSTETRVQDLHVYDEHEINQNGSFDPEKCSPQIEPNFQTIFWCSAVPESWLDEWSSLSQPQQPSLPLALPPKNPFVPSRYDIKELPHGDSNHPLLNSTIKVCTSVGKTKQWFPATVVQYDRRKNEMLLNYEDSDDQWHKIDLALTDIKSYMLTPDFEGTLDNKTKKFRILSLALPGMGGARKYGDERDLDAEEGKQFPPIPPQLSAGRLPKEISMSNTLRMWYLQDRNFQRPIADLRLQVICANANKTPLHRACADLLVDLVHDATLETSYLASVCELVFQYETSCVGFGLRFHGFDDKLLVLFESIFKVFMSFQSCDDSLPPGIGEARFEACLEALRRKYTNRGMTASSLSSSVRLECIRKNYWSPNKRLVAIRDLSVEVFAKTSAEILETFAVEALLHGNATSDDAKVAKNLILSLIGDNGLKRKSFPCQSVLRVPSVKDHSVVTLSSKDPTEKNTGVEVYIQVGKDSIKDRVLVDLLIHMMDDPIFNQIRTKDQFGYDVHCAERWTYGIIGMSFRVVSNVKNADEIVQRIDKFLVDYRNDTLENMTDTDLMEHLVAVATQKLEMFNSMSEETDAYWDEIVHGRFEWQAWRDEVLALQKLTKEDVVVAFDNWLNPGNKRKALAVRVIGGGNTEISIGHPEVDQGELANYADEQVERFQQRCKNQVWGRINSKLY